MGCSETKKKPKKKIDYIGIEKKKLQEELDASTILPYYKGSKLIFRTTLSVTSDKDELQKKAQQFKTLTNFAVKAASGEMPDFSSLYNNFSIDDFKDLPTDVTNYIQNFDELNEDEYPTLLNGIENTLSEPAKDIDWNNDKEHFTMAIILDAISLPPTMELYEVSKITGKGLGKTELRVFGLYYKGIILMQNGYYYLAEEAFNQAIKFVESKEFQWTGSFSYSLLKQDAGNKEQQLKALGFLLRGYARIKMEKPAHKKKGYKDLKKYVEITQSNHDVNELTLLTEAVLALKKDDFELSNQKLEAAKSAKGTGWAEEMLINEIVKGSADNSVLSENLVNNLIVGAILSDYLSGIVVNSDWYKYLISQVSGETLTNLPKYLEKEYNRLQPMLDLYNNF
jgi:tetratricopeptide (TPR) repeat protein